MFVQRLKFLISVVAIALATTACMFVMRVPADLDYARTRSSQAGLYRGTITPHGDTIPVGKLHTWTLHVATASGAPVEAANVEINGWMPQHGHGLPTKPRVTRELGNGDYLIEGMKFNMGGWWEMRFKTNSAVGADVLVFNLKL